MSLIVVHVFMPQIYGTNLLTIGLNVLAITTYLASPLAAVTNGAAIRAEGGIVPTIA